MNFLPVAQRELRVAARQTRTYGVRWLAAAVALVIVGYTRLYLEGWGVGGGSGRGLFFTLVGLAGWVCALGGARLTADAISREKREGTLGLLFLSHLSGLEVVLGKLVAQAALAFYALVATLPVLAIPFLAGGVEAGELWRALVGLTNALFFSVSLGLLVSSMTREPRTALGLATLGALGFWLALPAVASLLTARGTGGGIPGVVLACLTPATVPGSSAAFGFAAPNPWVALAGSQGLAWGFLLVAARFTRRSWRERPAGAGRGRWRSGWRDLVLGRPEVRAARRAEVLERNAFLWLLVRRRWKPLWPALFVGGVVTGMELGWWYFGRINAEGFYWSCFVPGCLLLHVVIKFWVAGEAVAGLVAHRREGTLELLVTTPLAVADVVRAQFLAVRRQFGLPLLVVGLLTLGGGMVPVWREGARDGGLMLVTAVAAVLALGADTFTLVWLGTWRALAARRVRHAAGGTAFRVLVLPWVLFILLTPFLGVGGGGPGNALLFWGFLGFTSDFLWWQWAEQQVRERFRSEAARLHEGLKPGWLERWTDGQGARREAGG
ncbi:MAG: ABC transporter permease subunit [Verrucomicrobiales bacterium]|nr:ABC transporter permease subunit [Verrucomicrobiales bacterium]